jgi:uncharacterized membrane protein
MNSNTRLILANIVAGAAITLAGLVGIDRIVAEYLRNSGYQALPLFIDGTVLFDTVTGKDISKFLIGLVITGAGLALLAKVKARTAAFGLLFVGAVQLLATLVAGVTKNLFGRLRPFELLKSGDWSNEWFVDGSSFPSGHALNSASFFASSNLLLIAAAAGALFGGDSTFRSVSALEVVKTSSRLLFEMQLALVLLSLARGLLDFIWSIRQLNYCIAAIGAVPENLDAERNSAFGAVVARLLNPALSSFNAGVRGYYFALAAAVWLFGPLAFMGATVGAVALLLWRQRSSPAAAAINDLRMMLDD